MRFWDSSAIIPLCVQEPLSSTMRELAQDDGDLVVWWGSSVECCSSFARLRRENRITRDDEDCLRSLLSSLGECWSEVEAVERVRTHARRLLLRHPLRAADALQLAAALVWADGAPEGLGLVCLDHRLREAARSEGFALFPPSL
jgi:hypothetical protein